VKTGRTCFGSDKKGRYHESSDEIFAGAALGLVGILARPGSIPYGRKTTHRISDLLVDVEGGAATLIVSPSGEPCCSNRISDADRDASESIRRAKAGLKQIDFS